MFYSSHLTQCILTLTLFTCYVEFPLEIVLQYRTVLHSWKHSMDIQRDCLSDCATHLHLSVVPKAQKCIERKKSDFENLNAPIQLRHQCFHSFLSFSLQLTVSSCQTAGFATAQLNETSFDPQMHCQPPIRGVLMALHTDLQYSERTNNLNDLFSRKNLKRVKNCGITQNH